MRLVLVPQIRAHLDRMIHEAQAAGRKIEKIVMTRSEQMQLSEECHAIYYGNVCMVSYMGILIEVEDTDGKRQA